MREIAKTATGIFLGLLFAGICGLCVFGIATFGGIQIIGDAIDEAFSTSALYLEVTEIPIPGHIMKCDDLGLSFLEYSESGVCPGNFGEPAEGAKFIIATIANKNYSNDVIEIPSIRFRLDGYESGLGSGGDCLYDSESFSNSCWQWGGKLYPGVSCEGWILFEVPISFDPNEGIISASFYDYETDLNCEAQWPLEPPK